ncbi:hypothetical protein N0V88_000115 [Collariella sp. IMI 366227]|nr:hypothetical protein N0V88_000115 [Collariella sp. IMI 366227]
MQQLFVLLLSWACLAFGARPSLVPGKGFERFLTIWLENQDYAKVTLDQSIVDLKRQGILLTRYYAQTHPSQPNYLAAIGGDYFGLNHDYSVRIPENVATVVDLLEAREVSWGGYFENMPSPGYMGNYSDGPTGNGLWDYRDFNARTVPQFAFLTPNMMNDGHNTSLEFSAAWSHEFLQPLLADKAFDERTLIMLTYDESEDYTQPNRIVTLLLGSAIPPALKGTQDDTFYTHYSILSTLQANWGLHNLGRYDVGANVFQFVADVAGYTNRDPENARSVNNSISYPGLLNDDPKYSLPIPVPNTQLIVAGGLPILPSIEAAYSGTEKWQTPYDGSGNVCDGDRNLPEYAAPAPNPP